MSQEYARPLAFRWSAHRGALWASVPFWALGCTWVADDFEPKTLTEPDAASMTVAPSLPSSTAAGPSTPSSGGVAPALEAVPGSMGSLPDDGETAPTDAGPGSTTITPGAADGSDAGALGQPLVAVPDTARLIGWASVAGLGVDTTTGGNAGNVVVASTADVLVELAARPEALTIGVEGTIDIGHLALTSNKTLVGIGPDARLRGGISIRGTEASFVSNVIVSNLSIDAATTTNEGDAIQIHYAHHVWIDHCALSDAPDGLIDIVHGSDFVTISGSHFQYTDAARDPDHRFVNQTGHDDHNTDEDVGHLNVTWHHDYFGVGVSKALAGRFGKMHAFNNVFQSPGNASVIAAGLGSSWLIESNQFEDVSAPISIGAESGASVVATDNVFVRTTGARDTAGTAFVPPYRYRRDTLFGLKGRVIAGAGPR